MIRVEPVKEVFNGVNSFSCKWKALCEILKFVIMSGLATHIKVIAVIYGGILAW